MRVHVVDPPAYTPPYDHALCAALARAGADVTLLTTRFAHGDVPAADGYAVEHAFYARTPARLDGRARQLARLAQHVPDMLRYRRAASAADVAHFQWLSVQQLDRHLLPRGLPLVLTAHDVLPRQPTPGQRSGQQRLYERVDAVVVHTQAGRERLTGELGIDPARISVIPHGAFTHLAELADPLPLAPELAGVEGPVVLIFGLLRPYKGLDVALAAWREITGAELWIVGMPRMDTAPLKAAAPPGVRFVERFVDDRELPALFARADLIALPYREAEQSGVVATALALGRPLLLSDVGGFPDVAATGAARLVAAGDAEALHAALVDLLGDPGARAELAAAATVAAREHFSWDAIARAHLDLYAGLTGCESPAP